MSPRSEKKIKVAVIGTGSIGMRHLRILKSLQDVVPIAIPLRSERLVTLKEIGFKTARDLKEAADLGVTDLIVATDTARHVADTLLGLEFKMNVMVEKPLSIDAPSCQVLLQAQEKSDKAVMIGCVMRFTESLQAFQKKLLEIGAVYSVRIECQSYLPDWRPQRDYRQSYSARQNEGGVLRDLIHEIDYAGKIFGWPQNVQGILRNRGRLGIESEEIAEIWWELDSGVSVSICLDYLSRIPRRVMRAFGEKGVLEWDGLENNVTLEIPEIKPQVEIFEKNREDAFLSQAKAFLKFTEMDPPLLATLYDGFTAMKILDAVRLSSKWGKGVEV